jgi:glycosyltransferase involved in cell wall biosynthesis
MVRTLFIFGGGLDREDLEKQIKDKTSPATSFLGFMELKQDSRLKVEYLQIKRELYTFAAGIVRKYLILDTLYLLYKLHKQINKYDVVVLTSSAYLNLLFLRRFGIFRHQKWIFLNIDLTTRSHKYAHSFIKRNVFLTTIRQADCIISLSKTQKDRLLELGLPEQQLSFIPLGIDKSFYDVLPPGNEFVLTVGNDLGRDLKTFIEAMRLLPEYKATVHCSPKNLEGLEDKIPKNINISLNKTYLDIRELYRKSSCFVIAMKPDTALVGSDCSGQTAILDSMAYGRAVIATHSPWLDGYFKDGESIVIVPSEDSKALAHAIRKVLEDEALKTRLVKNARALIDAQYNAEAMAKQIAKIIVGLTSA